MNTPTNDLARHSIAPPGRVARGAGGARVGRGQFKKPLDREMFASHAATARFFACPQPQPHLRAGGVSAPQTGRGERLLDAGADDDERVLLSLEDYAPIAFFSSAAIPAAKPSIAFWS